MSDLSVRPAAVETLEVGDAASGRVGFSRLRGLMRSEAGAERCDVCGTDLADDHEHLFNPAARRVICVCGACAVSVGEASDSQYLRVPQRIRRLADFAMSDAQWDQLYIPVGMAFFFKSSAQSRVVALYPGAAGVTESLLDLRAWEDLLQQNPVLESMATDVEALLVNRVSSDHEYYLVPIDRCYLLAGLIRSNWRGLSGGAKVWGEIAAFFAGLKVAATRATEVKNA
jgi:hypothetical protein